MNAAPSRARRRIAAAALLLSLPVLALALAGCGGGSASNAAQTVAAVPGGDAVPAHPAPPIELTDYRGHRVSLAGLKGKPVLVAFLYTHCHDLCPLVAANVHAAYARLKPGAARPLFLAISVDPAHDTRASATAFDRQHRTTGEIDWLLGSRPELKRVWKAWNIVPERAPSDPEVIGAAASAIVELGDTEAIADLIGVIERGDRGGEHARKALVALTAQDFGPNEKRWR